MKELLENIEKNYPFGTIIRNISGYGRDKEYTICGVPEEDSNPDGKSLIIKVKEKTDTLDNTICIWSERKGWAKIIKKGEITYEIY